FKIRPNAPLRCVIWPDVVSSCPTDSCMWRRKKMTLEELASPLAFLKQGAGTLPLEPVLDEYQGWWQREGQAISEAIDRAGTPWLRMFDLFGKRVDEILFAPEYWHMLQRGYQAGTVWRALAEDSLQACYLLDYVTSFYDPGLSCPYTVSLA